MSTEARKRFGIQRALLAAFALFGGSVWAQVPFSVTINLNEYGTATFHNSAGTDMNLPCQMRSDPGPGGGASVMFCGMLNPPGLVAGDVVIQDSGGASIDVLRFDPTIEGGGVFIYSDNSGGGTAPADVGLPAELNTNVVTITATGPADMATYTPVAGQPGFVAQAGGPVNYVFTEMGAIGFSKRFGALTIPTGGVTSLSFTLTNTAPIPLTGLAFTDTLPTGMTVAMPNGLTGACGGGTITANSGSNAVSLESASLAVGASCKFTVAVTGAVPGTQMNTTGMLTSNEGAIANPATAGVFVGAVDVTSQVSISMTPFSADRFSRNPFSCTVMTFTNNGAPADRTTRGTTIAGPLEIVLTNLPQTVGLTNISGVLLGVPYVTLQPSALPPGGQASVSLCFINPTGGPITFTPLVLSGAIF